MEIPIAYDVLRIIWWLLIGVLFAGFAIMDGFDLGVAMLLPWVGKNDTERRIALNTIGPVWEGNQVWFILGGGAIFAAWPMLYAVSFSGFYGAMFIILFALILRPVAIKYRSKLESARWRQTWDTILSVSGLVAALVFGVAIGNVLQGVPFHFDIMLRSFYTGSFWGLLNPFALLCGLTSVVMLMMQGGVYLVAKTENAIAQRASRIANISAVLLIVYFVLAGYFIAYHINGYELSAAMSHTGPSNPLHKAVVLSQGAWMNNFYDHVWLWAAPILTVLGAVGVILLARFEKVRMVSSSLSILGVVTTVGCAMFPFMLPSSSNPNESLLVWDASSSHLTLFIMLLATAIFLPIIILYTSWVYRVMRGKVTESYITSNDHSAY